LLLIFDLDGTLIDSSEDLAISVNATLRNAGRAELDRDTIQSYVGNGAGLLIKRAFGPDASEAAVADGLAFFLKFYRAHALEHTKLYPGVREAVRELGKQHTLAVLTNKPERISVDILAALDIADAFARIYGGDRFPNKKPHPVGIETLMQDTGIGRADTMMIGDSNVDIETARNARVRSCGVSWGFRPESFVACRPDLLIHTPDELPYHLQPVQ
jgi:phosphoglycolate phosphatase